VVTGGNGGIGRSIALGLAHAGAAIAVLARNEGKNQRVLAELEALGTPTLALKVDVTVRGQLQPALQQVEQTLGPVSILVNNAGIGSFGGVLEQPPEDWDRVIETNLNACFLLSKLAAPSMVKQRRGDVDSRKGITMSELLETWLRRATKYLSSESREQVRRRSRRITNRRVRRRSRPARSLRMPIECQLRYWEIRLRPIMLIAKCC